MRRLACLAFAVALLAGAPSSADDTDLLNAGFVQPNVMILLDSSGSMTSTIPGGAKIDIAKQVVSDLINNTPNVRFGVMKFRDNGASMVGTIGTDSATLVSAVNAMTITSVGTPLGDALYDVGRYFKGSYHTYPSPIDLTCRLNMVIVVSDGLENSSDRDLRDEATLRFTQDHSTTLAGSQNVVVHTVGFAINDDDEEAANDFLQQAATNGGGSFYSTDSGTELADSLQDAVDTIVSGSYSFAAALVPSTSVSGTNRLYQASFESDPLRPFWRGRLEAFNRGADGTVPTDSDGVPLASAEAWDAGTQLSLKASSTRLIYTVIGGARQAFTKGNGLLTPALLGESVTSRRDDIIDYIRGVDAFDEDGDGNTTEQRDWKLGDILHSAPVLVATPPLMSSDPLYQMYRQAQSSRTPILVVGANDGMLHAFRETDGEELWGFIPPDRLASLRDLTAPTGDHPYFVDGSPVVADVKIADAYRTVVLFGERRGGATYHALDVTDTTDPVYLWSFTDAKIAETWSTPIVGRIKMSGGGEKFVAFFGGGYDTPQNNQSGKAFFAVDMEDGTKLWEYHNDGSTDDRQYMNYSIASSPTALDLNGDGYIDRLYVGDVGGQLWKFDTSASAVLSGGLVTNWSGKRLFMAAPAQANPPPAGEWEPAQAMYAPPAPALDAAGDLWLYLGTGDLNHPLASSRNRFYGIRDDTAMTNGSALTEASLVDVTTANASGGNGWYIRLLNDEKVLSAADVFDEHVFFTTFTPAATVTCNGGAGPATLYAIRMTTGYGSIDWSTGEELESSDSSDPRSIVVGTGIPWDPTIVTTESDGILDTSILTGTTDKQLGNESIPAVPLRRILYWREAY